MLPEIYGTRLPTPPWKEFTLEIVLQYYDGPRLLLQRSNSEQLYLAWWSDSEASNERWIYLPVSRSRLQEILSGEIPSADALDKPEDGHIYVVDIDLASNSIIQTVLTEAAVLPDNAKPLPGARLHIPMPSEIDHARTEEPANLSVGVKSEISSTPDDATGTEYYRFRSIEYLLGTKYQELERQTIYFASPRELNDPMEGFRDIVWDGDAIVWMNLFKHFAYCLHWTYFILPIVGDQVILRDEHIPVMGRWDELPTKRMEALFLECWTRILDKANLRTLATNIASMNRKVRYNELSYYLQIVHFQALGAIREVHIEQGIELKESGGMSVEFPQFSSLNNNFFDLMSQVEEQHKDFDRVMFPILIQMLAEMRLKHKHIFYINNKELESNWQFLLLDFPEAYIKQLDTLLWPEWYTACFMNNYSNSSAWGSYGDGHRGVCLIFEADINDKGPYIELNRIVSRSSRSVGESKEHWGFSPMQFHDVHYSVDLEEVDFFRSMGRIPFGALSTYGIKMRKETFRNAPMILICPSTTMLGVKIIGRVS